MEALNISGDQVPTRVERFRIRGMHCANCATTIENAVAPLPGVIEAHVNFAAETLTARVNDERVAREIEAKVAAAGYQATIESGTISAGESALDRQDVRRSLRWVLVSAVGAALVIYLQERETDAARLATMVVATALLFSAGFTFYRGAW